MKPIFTKPFIKQYRKLPKRIQEKIDEQIALLLENPKHPSLGIKKMEGPNDIWEGRITQSYRFTYQTEGDTFILRRVGTYDILKNP